MLFISNYQCNYFNVLWCKKWTSMHNVQRSSYKGEFTYAYLMVHSGERCSLHAVETNCILLGIITVNFVVTWSAKWNQIESLRGLCCCQPPLIKKYEPGHGMAKQPFGSLWRRHYLLIEIQPKDFFLGPGTHILPPKINWQISPEMNNFDSHPLIHSEPVLIVQFVFYLAFSSEKKLIANCNASEMNLTITLSQDHCHKGSLSHFLTLAPNRSCTIIMVSSKKKKMFKLASKSFAYIGMHIYGSSSGGGD